MRRKLSSDQTAELALDDLGLELGSLEQTDSQIGLKPVDGCRAVPAPTRPPWSPASTRTHSACCAAAAARQAAMATPTIRSSPNTARAAPGSSPSASSAATWT